MKKSNLRHIDARQDWVLALCDAAVVKLVKVDTKDNLADLGTKLLDPGTFEGLHDRIMVNKSTPKSKLEQPSGASSPAQDAGLDAVASKPPSS